MRVQETGWAIRRGKRRYEARWLNAEGKTRAKIGFETKRAAELYSEAQMRAVQAERTGKLVGDRPATIDALLDLFLEKHGRKVDPATERKLRQQLRHARKAFGERNPESISKAEIEDWQLSLSAGSRPDVFRAFRQALAWASDPGRGLLARNPSDGIENKRRKQHERRPIAPFESWAEIGAVAAELDPRYAAIPIVAAGTGLRPEEWAGLHREDVDWERRRLHVQRRATGGIVKPGTKTGGDRYVPFGQKVYAALKAQPIRLDTPILFPAPRGGYIDIEKFRHREWSPALRAAGIAHRRLNDLRHTYASWSLAEDVPPAKLAKMMGTSIVQIEDTYHRFLKGDEERYGAVLDSFGA